MDPLTALLKKQREQKDRTARELQRATEELQKMRNKAKSMEAAIALKTSPQNLPKLKAEVERLRADCGMLKAAVDFHSPNKNALPLGETRNEEFYKNINKGQRLQSEGSWSCHMCTFRNHPLLAFCEQCDMPRISLGSTPVDVSPSLPNVLPNINTSSCMGGGTSTSDEPSTSQNPP